jgi:CheY-like chemotaxis protein
MADFQREAGSKHENKAVTVLVVEDEAMMRRKLAEELQNAGYLVVEASDGTEAVEILTVRRDVKIVISDVRMPGPIDGVELCCRVRSGYPGIKVVLSSESLMPPIRPRTTGSFSSRTESRGSLAISGRSRIEERTVLKRGN